MKLILFLFFITAANLYAQKYNSVGVIADLTLGMSPMQFSGQAMISNDGYMTINDQEVPINPVYGDVKRNSVVPLIASHIGLDLPFKRADYWSFGFIISAGLGFQQGFGHFKDYTTINLDFPQYLCYKHWGDRFEYSILLGYKYTYSNFRHKLVTAGFEYHFNKTNSIRLFSSILRDKYYTQYSNNTSEASLKIGEISFVITHKFIRKKK